MSIESELNLSLFDTEQTGGWVSSHFDIVDKFSPAEEPRARSVFTHKLNFEWDTAFHLFNKLPERNWLRNVEAEISLDYIATGLPKAGDVLGSERFVDKASPWSLSVVFVRRPESLDEIAQRYAMTHQAESAWLVNAQESDLARTLENSLIPGGRCSVAQAWMQVCMHSHGHRAQCAKLLRRHGAVPPAIDFITWLASRPPASWVTKL